MTPYGTGNAADTVAVGALLAGGEARRMGRDKRGLRLAGATLLERNLGFLAELFPTVALSVRDAGQVPPTLPPGVVVVPDIVPGSPLAGLGSLLTHFGEPVFALAADVAFPDAGAVRRVLAAFSSVDIALPIVEEHLEPLHAAYGPGCLTAIERLLARGAHSILDLLPEVRVATVPFATAAPFFNVNTPDDWNEAQRRAGGAAQAGGGTQVGATVERAGGGVAAHAVSTADPQPGETGPAGPPGGPAVLGVIGRPDSGKTTVIERLLPELLALGLRVATIKSVARFEIDTPGKDSWRHGRAGAEAYAVASSSKFAYVAELRAEMPLADLVRRYFAGYDLVICEGFRHEAPQVIEVYREGPGRGEPLCAPGEALALVTEAGLPHAHRFRPGEGARLARFLATELGLHGVGG